VGGLVLREQYDVGRALTGEREGETEEKYHERHERWMEHAAKVHNQAEVNIAKQRHGPIGTVRLFFDGALTKFGDLAEDSHIPDPMG